MVNSRVKTRVDDHGVERLVKNLTRSPLSLIDNDGYVLISEDRVVRVISNDVLRRFDEMNDSGLLARLVKGNYIPPTVKTKLDRDTEQTALEHHKYRILTYPFEWSSLMLKDAGIKTAKLITLLNKYGYTLKDCHPYNIVFNGTIPVYVDFSSIQEINSSMQIPWHEFASNYYFPLLVWQAGFSQYSRLSLAHFGLFSTSVDEHKVLFSRYRNGCSLLTTLHTRLIGKLLKIGISWKLLYAYMDSWQKGRFTSNVPSDMITLIKDLQPFPKKTVWSSYQDRYFKIDSLLGSPRYKRIIEICSNLKCKTAVDLACNQGYFSESLVKRAGISRLCAIDNDPAAIDSLYSRISSYNNSSIRKAIHPILSDIIPNPAIDANPSLDERCKSELVTALAITHHLVLGAGFSFSTAIEAISKYSYKYAVIEFMPKGLWGGSGPFPCVPDWYTKKGFVAELSKFYSSITEFVLETNRILFLCTI